MPQGVVGNPRKYDKKFLYAVEIEGLEVAWFESCSKISASVEVVDQHEAGEMTVADQSPGIMKVERVTLKIGSTDNDELYNWWLLVIDAANNSGEPDDDYKKEVAIITKDRNKKEKKRHLLRKAWPCRFDAADGYDAKASENVMEEIELVYKFFERDKSNQAT